jgi:hypothetical protein
VLLVGLGLTIVGGGITWANFALKDDDGYYTTKTLHIDEDSYAVVTKPADIHLGSAWGWDLGDLVKFKVEGSNNDPLKDIFIGVASESNITDYLQNVTYDEIVGFHIHPDELKYDHHYGNLTPGAPTNETFWERSVNGTGNQTLYWELETGRWVFAVMNADGSQGVDVSVRVGAEIPWLFPMGLSFLIVGVVGLAAGPVMIVLAVRRPRGPAS